MKNTLLFSIALILSGLISFGQKITVDLTFTANKNSVPVRLDSIKVMNRTQGGDTVIYWPDTTLMIQITPDDLLLYIGYSTGFPWGVLDINPGNQQFQLFQNYPNPVRDQSIISMFIPEKGTVDLMARDIQGRVVISTDWQLDKGNHSFLFIPGGNNVLFLTARWNGISRSIKILTTGANSGKKCALNYIGSGNGEHPLKEALFSQSLKMQESGILDTPETNKTYNFQFATNIPCPATPTVEYEGQVYNTIQIFSQCWLKENLNAGTMIPGSQKMANNNILEKYCYSNSVDSCTKYGGLYQWDEMMQYTTQQGAQGICPPGWHIPTDEEWKVLGGAVDSQNGIGDEIWDVVGYGGIDAGTKLKTISGWISGSNGTDLFGFSGLPGGCRAFNSGSFVDSFTWGIWWSSTQDVQDTTLYSWYRVLDNLETGILRGFPEKTYGFSVRCVRNN